MSRQVFVANCGPTGQVLPGNSEKTDLIDEILSLTDQFTEADLDDLPAADLEDLRDALEARGNSFPALSVNERMKELDPDRTVREQDEPHTFPALSALARKEELYGGTQ